MTNPNDEAFPVPTGVSVFANKNDEHYISSDGGLTKREWLAGIICSGMSANSILLEAVAKKESSDEKMVEALANTSVQQADALIIALNQNQK